MRLTAEARPPPPPWPGQLHREREPCPREKPELCPEETPEREGETRPEKREPCPEGSVPGGAGAEPEQPRPRRPRDAGAAAS